MRLAFADILSCNAEPPFVVTGAPRSGTTFVGRALSLPARVGRVFEPFNPQIGMEGIEHWFPWVEEGGANEADMARLVDRMLAGRPVFKRPDKPAKTVARRIGVALFRNLQNLLLLQQRFDPRVRRLCIKDPIAAFASEWLHRRYHAPVIVMVRHPASLVASHKRLGWEFDLSAFEQQPGLVDTLLRDHLRPASSPIEQAAVLWRCVYAVLFRYLDRNERMVALRHEDVSRDPVECFRALYAHLGLTFTAGVERWIVGHTDGGNPAAAPGNAAHVLRRDSKAVVEQWRTLLSDDEVATVRGITGEVAARFYGDEDW